MPRAARPRAADDEPAPVGPPALEELLGIRRKQPGPGSEMGGDPKKTSAGAAEFSISVEPAPPARAFLARPDRGAWLRVLARADKYILV